jgi:hypothetical protein
MDGIHFDSLTRSLTQTGSRRRALAATLGGALGVFGLVHPDDAAAGGKCKPACNECATCKKGKCRKTPNGKKCKKGKCKPKPAGTACSVGTCQSGSCVAQQTCTPNCTDKVCGDNGCGGSCGSCTDPRTCESGQCTCPEDECGGTCVAACQNDEARNTSPGPDACSCCMRNFSRCDPNNPSECCSGRCVYDNFFFDDVCHGRSAGARCDFDEQCWDVSSCQPNCDGNFCTVDKFCQ